MLMKKILVTTGLLTALMLSGKSHAQQIPEGPFQSINDLIVTWDQFAPYVAAYVFVDGQLVYQRRGFGPAASKRYFICPQDATISVNCPSEGPFQSASAIISYWRQVAPQVATSLYLDGVLIESRGGFGPALARYYITCHKRAGGGLMTNCKL
jgi:hypothetical protein